MKADSQTEDTQTSSEDFQVVVDLTQVKSIEEMNDLMFKISSCLASDK